MQSRMHLINWRLLPVIFIMWLATASDSFAITPITVDIKPFADGFVMARADGLLTWTDMDGNPIDSVNLKMDIAGIEVRDVDVLAVSGDMKVMKVDRKGRKNRLCRSQIQNAHDHVTGIASTKDNTFILTESGVVYTTTDFKSFNSLDFNRLYTAFYDEVSFCSICASDNYIYMAGTYRNGMPAVFTSGTGKIWSERGLTYTEEGMILELEQQPLNLAYDSRMDRFVLACTDGYLFYMPGCSHCNSIEHKSMQDITAVAFNDGCSLFR